MWITINEKKLQSKQNKLCVENKGDSYHADFRMDWKE